MKLTVLGNSGGFPAAGGATSGYLLEIEGHYILIDCGSGVLSNMFRYINIAQLDAVIITHLHSDHISDVDVLKYAVDLSRKYGLDREPLPVFAPATPEMAADSLQGEGLLIVGQLKEHMKMNLYGANLETYRMNHPVETYGLRIEHEGRVFAFTADSTPCESLDDLLQDADLAIMDAGMLEKHRKPVMMHLTAAECAETANRCGVKRLLLTHILPLIDPAELLAEASAIRPETELTELLAEYKV